MQGNLKNEAGLIGFHDGGFLCQTSQDLIISNLKEKNKKKLLTNLIQTYQIYTKIKYMFWWYCQYNHLAVNWQVEQWHPNAEQVAQQEMILRKCDKVYKSCKIVFIHSTDTLTTELPTKAE